MRTDKHIVADSDVTQYTREGPDLDAAPYGGVTLTGGISRYASCPQYHTSEDVTVITDYRCLANDRAMPMVQDESTANLASWVDFRARQELSTRGDQERGSLQRSLRIAFRCASQTQHVGKPVVQHCLERAVAKRNVGCPSLCGWILAGECLQVFLAPTSGFLEHRMSDYPLHQLG